MLTKFWVSSLAGNGSHLAKLACTYWPIGNQQRERERKRKRGRKGGREKGEGRKEGKKKEKEGEMRETNNFSSTKQTAMELENIVV